MPTLSTTIEDTSPVIVYSGSAGGDWIAGTSGNDSATDQYSQSSFMVTQTPNASISFSFYGTGVQIYGAKRSNHGLFQVQIDSTVYPQVNGNANNPEIFQTALFSTVALDNGFHNVTMRNVEPGTALDIDFLTWQTPIGLTNEALVSVTAQDSDSSFKYTPESEWNASPPNLGMFSGGSGHVTTTAGACMEYTFSGATVAIFGPVGPNGAPYSVQLDQGPPANYSSYKRFYRPQTMLFQAGNLASGQHTIRIVSEAWNNSALTLGIDYAEVFTAASLQKSSAALSAGAIAGISIVSFALFLLLVVLVLFVILRWRSAPFVNLKTGFLRLKEKSKRKTSVPGIFTSPEFDYQPINTPTGVSEGEYVRPNNSQNPSHTPLNGITSPSSGMWPSSGGTYAPTTEMMISDHPNSTSQAQVITIPFTSDGKYRPDLSRSPTPLLMPPPQRQSQVHHRSSSTPSASARHPGLLSLPPGARPPSPNLLPLPPPPGGLRAQAVLTPVRRPGQAGYVESRRQNVMPFENVAMGSSATTTSTGGRTSHTAESIMSPLPPLYQRDPS